MSTELFKTPPIIRVTDASTPKSNHHAVYFIASCEGRKILSYELRCAVNSVFLLFPTTHPFYQHHSALLEAIGLIKKESPDSLLVRKTRIQKLLNKLMELLEEMEVYSSARQNLLMNHVIGKDLKKVTKKLVEAINTLPDAREKSALSNMLIEDEHFVIQLGSLTPSTPALANAFNYGTVSPSTKNTIESPADESLASNHQESLTSLSPELKIVYEETESLIKEVSPLVMTAEDEYFLEQIKADYYPHIFNSLKSLTHAESDFGQLETVVLESIKQFKIIQLGLQKIIDRAVAHRLAAIKSQTDFLRNKVLGAEGFSLTPNEAENVIETSLAEAQRIREELYKKHVAPVLEKNKQEYEHALAENKQKYRDAVEKLEEEQAENIEDFHRTLQEQEQSFATEQFALSDRMRRMQYDHRVQIEQLNKEYKSSLNDAVAGANHYRTRFLEMQKERDAALFKLLESQEQENAAQQELIANYSGKKSYQEKMEDLHGEDSLWVEETESHYSRKSAVASRWRASLEESPDPDYYYDEGDDGYCF